MKIGFTGTRRGLAELQAHTLRRTLRDARMWNATDFHHGDCVGADFEATEIAAGLGYYIVSHPPLKGGSRAWGFAHLELPAKDYLDRDRDIVDATDVLVACPRTAHEERRSGTWYTIRYARQLGRAVMIIRPDGAVDDSRDDAA